MQEVGIEVKRAFQCAALNQFAFDSLYYDFLGRELKAFNGVPRPSKWLNKGRGFVTCIAVLSKLILHLWCCFAFVYFFAKAISFFSLRKKYKEKELDLDAVALGVCDRSYDVINQAIGIDGNITFLTLLDSHQNNLRGRSVSVSGFLDFRDVLHIFLMSCKIHLHLMKCEDGRLAFQSYAVVDWLAMYYALRRINPKHIITAEHHDRWAVLADFYAGQYSVGSNKISFTVVQHGLEFESTYKRMRSLGFADGLPCKIKNLTKIYCYSSEQFSIFVKDIFSHCAQVQSIACVYYQFGLVLSDVVGGRKSVLFVGSPICENFHMKLYSMLCSCMSIECYYKPHPTSVVDKAIGKLGWIVIEDKGFFPRVDLVVSYPSTLVDEYRRAGVLVLQHPLECGDDELCAFYESMKEALV